MADHIIYKCIAQQYCAGYEGVTAGDVNTSSSTAISVTGATSLGANRVIAAIAGNSIDGQTTLQATSSFPSDDPDVTGEAIWAWVQAIAGHGGGFVSVNGQLAAAGSSGTFTNTWSTSSPRQASLSFACIPTGGTPQLYDQTDGSGTDDVVVSLPIAGSNFYFFLIVQTANEEVEISAGTGWTLLGSIGTGTAGASGACRITVFGADKDSDPTAPTLSIVEAAADVSVASFSRVPEIPVRRRPMRALALSAMVSPLLPPAPPDLSWAPEYVDSARREPTALNVGGYSGPAATLPDVVTPDLPWSPIYPGQVPAKRAALDAGGRVGPDHVELGLGWSPTFPSSAPAARAALLVGGRVGGDFSPAEGPAPELSWSPTFPGSAPGARVPVNAGGWFGPAGVELDLSWAPIFPDPVLRVRAPVSAGGRFGDDFARPDIPAPEMAWSPRYPAQFELVVLRQVAGSVHQLLTSYDDSTAPELSWHATYPDLLERARTAVAGWMVEPHADATFPRGWLRGVDAAPALRRNAGWRYAVGETSAPRDTDPGELPTWRSVYPDAISRRKPASVGEVVAPVLDLSTSPLELAWSPTYPDRVSGKRASHVGPSVAHVSGNYGPAPELAWQPEHIDLVRRVPRPVNVGGQAPGPIEPLPNVLPELAWQPIYPAWFPSRRWRPIVEPAPGWLAAVITRTYVTGRLLVDVLDGQWSVEQIDSAGDGWDVATVDHGWSLEVD